MKTLFISVMAIVAAFASPGNSSPEHSTAGGAASAAEMCRPVNNVYASGEKLQFKIYYNWKAVWLSAGELVFKVTEEQFQQKPVYHIVAAGQTYKSYEWFYKVRDKYETYVDQRTLKPIRFARDVYEGGFIIKDQYDFDHSNKTVQTTDFKNNTKGEFAIPECIHDVVSAIYQARTLDFSKLKVGDKVPFSIFIDNEVYDLYFKYMGKETLKTKMGTYKTIKITPMMLNNEYFKGGEHMTIWITDDKNKMPVRIESPLSVGSIKVDLKGYSGLLYPPTAAMD